MGTSISMEITSAPKTNNNTSLLTPDPQKRANSIIKKNVIKKPEVSEAPKKPDDTIAVMNDAIKQYNEGCETGSTKTNFRHDQVNYCAKLKEILGDELLWCLPENLRNTETDRIYFQFKQ